MSRQPFEQDADRYDPAVFLHGEQDSANAQLLEGLPDPRVTLFEIGRALAAALAIGIFLCALLQWIGAR